MTTVLALPQAWSAGDVSDLAGVTRARQRQSFERMPTICFRKSSSISTVYCIFCIVVLYYTASGLLAAAFSWFGCVCVCVCVYVCLEFRLSLDC